MKSKVLGSTLIIAGTTIGAGMLALPIASAGIGFGTSLIIMLGLWALMAYTALLMVELHQHADHSATLHTLAKQILGKKGQYIASIAMLVLFYALCAAYIAGGGGQFRERVQMILGIELSNTVATLIFTFLVALTVTLGTHAVDKLNRVLFTIKLFAMGGVLFLLAPSVSHSYLLSMPVQQGLILAAIPVIFTSFGFHGSIPAIVNYLKGDTGSLRKAIIIGSSLPLVIYVFWQIVTLGVVSQTTLLENSGLSNLISSLAQTVHVDKLATVIGVFADLALMTSFLGVSLGLFEYLRDLGSRYNTSTASNNNETGSLTSKQRVIAAVVTFTPPLCFALFYPQGFIMALGYAAIALATLAIFLPVAMIKKIRRDPKSDSLYVVAGGQTALNLSFIVGLLIVASQILISMNVLPSL
ncbi:tyrosine transporter TyrP [Vibrio sp. 10N.286.49.C2]|uniref:aromatic amino acid transport family protein n=1 Tax=unclassified Vibrio TaxID=2614977 RepID=UPI000C8285DB|nr:MULTISPECIES: aromatic amino acid transport family protein [unclassified Vibrio]PMH34784.1 tyrosine transporter TyrP [Vibrio sp. 10N.286.49.C2]PMH51428.1 tyrosine transporter TyrP [Vibrio sp. 10N.286.49.B1]PMH79377.1 tyrosine transporter TyrP [Vibrio sp. 10N.286.48.B7]